ncbi:hypothetical protein TIFTF001_034722 [Ficus carica]|uniref:Uncharacterized protein n=1 Tax=Ficus carica TaxID=3494 RepID=A0AA88E0P9_FICCA|nr:hypothetical protein TIFTF001_034722 [Ficus carica]
MIKLVIKKCSFIVDHACDQGMFFFRIDHTCDQGVFSFEVDHACDKKSSALELIMLVIKEFSFGVDLACDQLVDNACYQSVQLWS